ncbi:glycoside hydrolase family 43 protein [Piedraia hortae CBS 480.64]|uniref:Glycoside hydrolase family 43 protein n=1 Tax=Piedraia hortae CBS 480.64 TaxID=1314780 RepID=A0A6A7C3J5_9PEZI|nr:glycoside hydrolase family 43 protein [Piedraia hortae CBS 480.64]
MFFSVLLLALPALALPLDDATDATTANITERAASSPIMGGLNFPDPSVIRMADGWHAFATNAFVDGKRIHVQVANTPDFKNWNYRRGYDAMPNLPDWIDKTSPRLWAPDVNQLPNGKFIMYYTAAMASKPTLHCVSYAISDHVEGPYSSGPAQPWVCPTDKGGAIDPSGYLDRSGSRWVVYKVDGNAIGHGGVCGNTLAPIVPTPIMLQQVDATDGITKIGSPIQLITNGKWDGPVVEAPSLTKLGDRYVLFFSSNCFATTKYDVSYATSTHITGPYTKYGPLFVTGSRGMTAPGGLDIAVNGDHVIWHANIGSGRASFTGVLSMSGNDVRVISTS